MRGMIHVYTGDGKGKTTSAFGLAARAAGHGKRVLFAQFLKGGGSASGEVEAGRRLGIEILRFKQVHPFFDPAVDVKALIEAVQKDFDRVIQLTQQGDYDMVVLDEVNNCVSQNFLPATTLIDFMETKPEGVELVLTGRGADQQVIEKADYVTEMKKLKHPAETEGTPARKGIEF